MRHTTAVAVPSLLTYGLYYAATAVVCLILAVQQLGRAPLWPPRWRDAPLTLVPLPLILASMFAISAIATWVLHAPLKQEPPSQSSATSLLGTVAHIDTLPELLIRSVWTGIGEEAAAVLLVVGLTRRAVPLPLVYTIAALVRVTYHAQFSLAAVGLVILGVGMVWLWRRYERLLPLIAAHTLWDAIGGNHPEFLIGLTGAGLLTIIGFYARSSVLKLSRRLRGDVLNPGASTSSADTVAS
jgi:membrane protease YdiL (CAAX protease family)